VILDAVRKIAPIKLDPCTVRDNPTGAEYIRTPDCDPDGLQTAWHEFSGLVYVNPPYGRSRGNRCREWVLKAITEYYLGAEIVMLLPARTDTEWFHLLWPHCVMCFLKGRLVFKGQLNSAPFPSMLAYLGERPDRFREVFRSLGATL
jgi:site-specific DNA-methyltransferase (adenine-specific)